MATTTQRWSCLCRMAWISWKRTKKPSMSSPIRQKSMAPELFLSSFLPAHKAPCIQMESSVAKMNASCWLLVGPSNQLAFLLYSKNPTLIFSSLVAGDTGAMEDTCERLQLRYVPGELVLWVWVQSLEFTSTAMISQGLELEGPPVTVYPAPE